MVNHSNHTTKGDYVKKGKRGQAPLQLEYWKNGKMEEWKSNALMGYRLQVAG
jgi:hypothetical protein